MATDAGHNPLGIPTPDDWPDLARRLRAWARTASPETLRAQAQGDRRALEATGRRWRGLTPPWPLRPADLLMLRWCAVDQSLPARPGAVAGETTLAALTLDATPYWLSGRVAWGLARTERPEAGVDLRLPMPAVLVCWSAPLEVGEVDLRPDWARDGGSPWTTVEGRHAWPSDLPWEMTGARVWDDPSGGRVERSVIEGVILLADPEGHPVDVVVWMVWLLMAGGERDGGWVQAMLPGRVSLSGWSDMLWSLTAIVAWGDWQPEPPLWTHNRGKLRRLGLLGVDLRKLGPIRVLRAVPRRQLPASEEPAGTHSSPTTHIRRGHWRNQVHGPGRAERKLIWVPPVVVNPGHEGDPRETIYSLPPPERRLARAITPDDVRD